MAKPRSTLPSDAARAELADERLVRVESELASLQRLVGTLLTELRQRGLDHLPKTVNASKVRMSPEARKRQLKEQAELMRKHRWKKKPAKKTRTR